MSNPSTNSPNKSAICIILVAMTMVIGPRIDEKLNNNLRYQRYFFSLSCLTTYGWKRLTQDNLKKSLFPLT